MRHRPRVSAVLAVLLVYAVLHSGPLCAEARTARVAILTWQVGSTPEETRRWYEPFTRELAQRGWVEGKNLAGTWDGGKAKVLAYIDTHVRLAREADKPLVFEEFGFPRDGELYDPSVPTTFRQRYYRLIYGAAEASLAVGGPVQGTNFWAWNGEARAQHPDHRFHEGDTQYMGDPPHEPQGWYGNFDSDAEMMTIIRNHANAFATA